MPCCSCSAWPIPSPSTSACSTSRRASSPPASARSGACVCCNPASTACTALVALGFCLLLALSDAAVLLRWYPVLLSLFLLAVFGLSLLRGQPLIERLARLREPELPPRAVRYTRRVTQVWCLFFLGNALTAAGLALWAPLAWWTLYTGVIAYGLMGLLFAGEWLVRQRVRRLP